MDRSKDLNAEEILQDLEILDLENSEDNHVSVDSVGETGANRDMG